MQIYLPYPDFEGCALILSDEHLKIQRLHVHQALRILHGRRSGWSRHTLLQMWRDNELALTVYGLTLSNEWLRRGHFDKGFHSILDAYSQDIDWELRPDEMPQWWGIPELHISHQSALLRIDPVHYRKWFKIVPDDLPTWWPDEV